jgi:serine/threonine protein kinase
LFCKSFNLNSYATGGNDLHNAINELETNLFSCLDMIPTEENVLIERNAATGNPIAKLADFGHAKFSHPSIPRITRYGTKDLTSPELLRNLKLIDGDIKSKELFGEDETEDDMMELDHVTGYPQDVWAVGLLLFTMLHGNLPQENDLIIAGNVDLDGFTVYPTKFRKMDRSKF